MKTHIITIVSRKSTHYAIQADTPEKAIEQAEEDWRNSKTEREVNLGSEFAEIEDVYVDKQMFGK